MIIIDILFIASGILIIIITLYSATSSLVLPRGAFDPLTSFVLLALRRVMLMISHRFKSYESRDRLLAYLSPVALLLLVPVWFLLFTVGYTLIYLGVGVPSLYESFRFSGSSLLTLGFAARTEMIVNIIAFTEATIGLMMVALLIAYLPTIYSAFSRREKSVRLLEVRAGNPPSAVEILQRYQRIHGLEQLTNQWQSWEIWFSDIAESHTSLPALVFLRSPVLGQSWVTAAGAVLDAASLTLSTVDIKNDPHAALCIRAGYLALNHIADFMKIPYHEDPHFPEVQISVTKEEFEQAYTILAQSGVPVRVDKGRAWVDFAGWRVNYDMALTSLANVIIAPDAPWTGDRRH